MAVSMPPGGVPSLPGERRGWLAANRPITAERRQKFRYPLEFSVRFRLSSVGYSSLGSGVVVNMSSGGILVASKHQIIEGALVEMRIEWPCALHGRIPLQLVAIGRVLRGGPAQFAAKFE